MLSIVGGGVAVAYDTAGTTIATMTEQGTFEVWDLADPRLPRGQGMQWFRQGSRADNRTLVFGPGADSVSLFGNNNEFVVVARP